MRRSAKIAHTEYRYIHQWLSRPEHPRRIPFTGPIAGGFQHSIRIRHRQNLYLIHVRSASVVKDTFCSVQIQNTKYFWKKMYLKYFYQILLKLVWKYKIQNNTFSKCISNTKYIGTGNCRFLNSGKRHYRICSRCQTVHTTQSLHFTLR